MLNGFALWRRAVLILSAIGVLSLLALRDGAGTPHKGNAPRPALTDIEVYQKVAAQVATGSNYYRSVVAEHRRHDYPLKPFFTVRPPTLAWLTAATGPDGASRLAQALLLVAAAAWLFASPTALEGAFCSLFIVAGGFVTFYHPSSTTSFGAGYSSVSP